MIEELLVKSLEAFKQHYSAILDKVVAATPPSQFNIIHSQAEESGKKVFQSTVENLKKEWLLKEPEYKSKLALAGEEVKGLYKEYKKLNEKRILDFLERATNSLFEEVSIKYIDYRFIDIDYRYIDDRFSLYIDIWIE